MRTRRSLSSSDPVVPEVHRSVLLHETIEGLALRESDVVVDATLGGAGHARDIARHLSGRGTLVGFDLDAAAVKRASDALQGASPNVVLIEDNFRTMAQALRSRGITRADKVLFDLGWSAYQLDAGKGFSFLKDEPLSMSYAAHASFTASDIVNHWEESSIADVLFGWGEERYARRIARRIVEARQMHPIETSRQLAEVIREAVPPAYRHGRIHPATKTFQALRIAVNDELGALQEGLKGAWEMLAPGGRIAVISFHSIEDRMVKQQFALWEKDGGGTRLTKKPIVPSGAELAENPRARSAKLRIIEKNV